jgi:cytochrome c553
MVRRRAVRGGASAVAALSLAAFAHAQGVSPAAPTQGAAPAASVQGAAPAAAAACAVCHGPKGIATAPETPHLAGQPQGYLVAQLKAFRDGTRKHEVMAVIAKALSDADIDTLSRWYASIEIEAK